ncbi:hypothetical protein BPC006_II0578 [Burkholderia pseudomallei BPC006]|nr:hypothetical protein BPC006_II0578 [Burkholderia pseudomallei BPC006]
MQDGLLKGIHRLRSIEQPIEMRRDAIPVFGERVG